MHRTPFPGPVILIPFRGWDCALCLGAMQMQHQLSHLVAPATPIVGVIKNKVIFTHVPDRIENKMHFPQHDEWVDSILQFADGPFPVKEKQERIFLFFLLYMLFFFYFFMKENAQVQGWEEAGWRSTVARMMTLPSSQPQAATTRIMIAEGSEYPAISGSLSDFLSESPSCMNDLCKQAIP